MVLTTVGSGISPDDKWCRGLYLLDVEVTGIGVADEVPRAVVGKLGVISVEFHLHVVRTEEFRLVGILLGIDIEAVVLVVEVTADSLGSLIYLIGGNGGLPDVAATGVEDAVGSHLHPCLTVLAFGPLLGIVAVDDQGYIGELITDVAYPYVEGEGDELPAVLVEAQVNGDVVGAHLSVVDKRGIGAQPIAAGCRGPQGKGVP